MHQVPHDEDDEGKYAVPQIRKLGALTLAIPLAAGIVAFGPGTAAEAEGTGIKSPAGNAVITSGSRATVTAHLALLAIDRLYVRGPGFSDRQIASGTGPKDISGTVGIARNGAYVATLKDLLGSTIDQRTFYVRVPPSRPTGVDTSVSDHKLVVRWDRGDESDLSGYNVYVGGKAARTGSTGALCAGKVCSTALSLPASGGRVDVGVRALRPDGLGGKVPSKLATATAVLPGAGALANGRGLSGLPPQTTEPLLPLQGRSPLTLPNVAPNGQTPGFQYPAPAPQVANPAAAAQGKNASSTSPLKWGKSLAIALILLVLAAHLGMWTRRQRLAQAAAAGASEPAAGEKPSPDGKGRTRKAEPNSASAASDATAPAALERSRPVDPGRDAAVASTGRLIDAKAPVADAAMLNAADKAVRPLPEHLERAPEVVGATARARSAAPSAKPRAPQPKAKRSSSRRSSGYRGRRRAN